MGIPERLVEIREANGYTRKRLAEELGKPYATITKYETGEREPGHAYIIEIAKKFGVTTDYILGISNDATAKISLSLSSTEAEHIQKYRSLDEHGKNTVSSVLDCEKARCDDEAARAAIKSRNIIPFRLSAQSASAGTGAYLGPEEFNTIFVLENALTRRTSFGVTVSGDSMEPLYHDGDILMVERTHEIGIGEIGVFTVDGEGYVKKFDKNLLISLNSKYDPVCITEDTRCNGRVIGILNRDWIVQS